MTNTRALSALWVGLALDATLLAIWFKISTALSDTERVLKHAHCPVMIVH